MGRWRGGGGGEIEIERGGRREGEEGIKETEGEGRTVYRE